MFINMNNNKVQKQYIRQLHMGSIRTGHPGNSDHSCNSGNPSNSGYTGNSRHLGNSGHTGNSGHPGNSGLSGFKAGLWRASVTAVSILLMTACSSAGSAGAGATGGQSASSQSGTQTVDSQSAGHQSGAQTVGGQSADSRQSVSDTSDSMSTQRSSSYKVGDVVPEYVFTYAENQTSDYPTTQAARYFAKLVNQETEGRIEIRVYPRAELGDEKSSIEQLCFGGIDFARVSLGSTSEYSEESVVLQMPYLYKNADHMWRVLDGEIGARIKESFEGSGIVALAWFDAGVRNFYTIDGPINRLEDVKGLKIRVQQSELAEDMVTALGAEPVPIVYEDVEEALQTHAVDGAENNWSSYEAMGHNTYAGYYCLDEHMRVPELMLMSEVTWNKMSTIDQNIILQCAIEAGDYERELWKKREDSSRDKCLQAGTVEIVLSDEEKQRFREAVDDLYTKYCSEHMDLVKEITEAGQQ